MKEFLENMIKNNPGFSAYLDEALRKDKVIVTRAISIATMVMYLLFIVVDQYSLQQNRDTILIIRLVVISYLLFCLFSSYREKFLLKHYGLILVGFSIMSGGGIELMILISEPDELAFYTYFAGLMMVTIGVFTWTYLNSTVSLLVSLFFIFFYLAIFLVLKNTDYMSNMAVLINHVSFLMGAVVIGLLSDIVVKRYLYRQYRMQSRLRDLLLGGDFKYSGSFYPPQEFPNRNQFINLLQQQIDDAYNTNLALSLGCIHIPLSDQAQLAQKKLTISRVLETVLPVASIKGADQKGRFYYAYLLRHDSRDQVQRNNQQILSLMNMPPCNANRIGAGSILLFQNPVSAQELIAQVEAEVRISTRKVSPGDDEDDEKDAITRQAKDSSQVGSANGNGNNVTPIRPMRQS